MCNYLKTPFAVYAFGKQEHLLVPVLSSTDQPTNQKTNQPAGIDAVDAVVNGRPAHSNSSIVLKSDQIMNPCWENYDKAISKLVQKGRNS